MKFKYLVLIASAAGLLSSCKNNFKSLDTPTAGEADFSKYVAIGNSLTAGYADNSLTRDGQENSYPNMLSQQFKMVGGGNFVQPLLPGSYGWPSAKYTLGYQTDCKGVTALGPIPNPAAADTAGSSNRIGNIDYNNLGVPGIKVAHLGINGYGVFNPYAARFFRNPSLQTPLEVFLAQSPSFFTVWLGGNDVLGYATSGGEGNIGGMGTADITHPELFKTMYDSLVNNLVKGNAKGVLINIPDVTSIPFFTTIDRNGATVTAEEANRLNQHYKDLGYNHISFREGKNAFVVEDDRVGVRHIEEGEFLLLTIPANELKCNGLGTMKPLPKRYFLDAKEVATIREYTTLFNQTIQDAARTHGLAYMDAGAFMRSLSSGFAWDGIKYSPTFVTGGAFSLDGVHLTPRGYALVANQIITTINTYYKANIPYHDVNKYPGIKFP